MPCYRPLKGWRSATRNSSGKRSIVFSASQANRDMPVTLPCGQCIGCRLEHSRQIAIRAMHEASLYENNCFLTLTYADEYLPANGSIDPEAPVLFMKRLRKTYGAKIRSFGCAEYGEQLQRPHYHICLFNFDFSDKKPLKEVNGYKVYVSKNLEKLWPYGHSTVGTLTFESAAYTARYVTKKITGKKSQEHYGARAPEKPVCVSRRPGLGKPWLEKFHADVYSAIDGVILRGKKMKPPKYYDRIFDIANPDVFAKTKLQRKKAVLKCGCLLNCLCVTQDNEPARLDARERNHQLSATLLKRTI